ncbi:MAG: hypothetical protein R2825_27095 [Saprospiraceae bacterium]
MDIQAEKIWLIDQIAKIKDERLLQILRNLLEFTSQPPLAKKTEDFWDELSDTQKQQIEKSIQQLENGEGIPHNMVMEEFKTKYRRAS